jgi:hypothetical protein
LDRNILAIVSRPGDRVSGRRRWKCVLVAITLAAIQSIAAAQSGNFAPGDANCDGVRDAADVGSLIVALFNESECPAVDINNDDATSGADLVAVVYAATRCGRVVRAGPVASAPCPSVAGKFVDCFATSGFDAQHFTDGENGAAVADVDGDGFPDVFYWNTSDVGRLFRNLGEDMRFENITEAPLIWPDPVTAMAAAFGDLDNDGQPDLVVVVDNNLTAYQCRSPELLNTLHVYRNVGNGQFTEVTDAWGVAPVPAALGDKPVPLGLNLVDLNLDGRLDIVEHRQRTDLRPLVFLSQPDGLTWQEAGRDIFGDANGLTFTIFFTDANNDLLLDAFTVNDYHPFFPAKYFQRVDRSLTFEEAELLPTFGKVPHGSPMGAATADLNGDGSLDLIVSDTGDQHVFSLGVNVEDAWGVKQNPSRFGLPQNCWSPAVLDLENDGRPDLFFTCAGFRTGSPDKAVSFILRNQGGVFELAEGLLPDEDAPSWEEGLAVADFDQDGRIDFLTGGTQYAPRLLWNRVPAAQALAIRLRGTRVNAQGIGARVTVEVPGLPIQVREMFPGGATWGYSDSQLLFGIADATRVNVTVDWRPAGGEAVQTLEAAPGALLITEP